MKARTLGVLAVAVGLVGVAASVLEAGTIVATGTATLITDPLSPYRGWYKYEYTIMWDLEYGLSHVDILLKPGCAEPDHLYAFDVRDLGLPEDGHSTGDGWEEGDPVTFTVPYVAEFLPDVDPSTGVLGPMVKWEAAPWATDEPGKQGVGEFWFYANIYPETGVYPAKVVAKHDGLVEEGEVSGEWPSCTPTPEPAALALLAVGALPVLFSRRRRR